jgi:hypothetical protein
MIRIPDTPFEIYTEEADEEVAWIDRYSKHVSVSVSFTETDVVIGCHFLTEDATTTYQVAEMRVKLTQFDKGE